MGACGLGFGVWVGRCVVAKGCVCKGGAAGLHGLCTHLCNGQVCCIAGQQVHGLGSANGVVKAGRKLLCGGGGGHGSPFSQPPPAASLAAVTGGGVQGGGARPAVLGGGGGQPNIWLKMIPTSR